MVYEVGGFWADGLPKIDWAATGVDEVLQNVAIILTTVRWSVPGRLTWYIDASFLSWPMPVAQTRIAVEVFQAIRRHEPRFHIVGPIRFVQSETDSADGRTFPHVTGRVVL